MGFDVEDNWADASEYLILGVVWKRIRDSNDGRIYQSTDQDPAWFIRLNDYPDEPLHTLLVGSKEIIHFNEWPSEWVRIDKESAS